MKTLRPMSEFPHDRADETAVYVESPMADRGMRLHCPSIERAVHKRAEHDHNAVGWCWKYELAD